MRLLLLSILSEALYLLLAAQSRIPPAESPLSAWYRPTRFEETVVFLGIWAALFLVYVLAIRSAAKSGGRALFVLVFLTSALFRSNLLWKTGFSTDAPRAFLQAESPLTEATDEIEFTLRAGASVVFDLGSLALLPGLLKAATLPAGLAIVHGWNPLLVKESAGSARLEPIALFFLLLAFRCAQKRRFTSSALAYGAALLGPPVFWATFPLLAVTLRLRVLLSLVIGGVGFAVLATSRSFPDLLGWPPANFIGGSLMPSLSVLSRLLVTRDPLVPLAACALLWCAIAAIRTWKLRGSPEKLPREALILLGWLLLLSPQVLPRSFLPIGSLAAFASNRGWLVFTATAPLAYLALGEEGFSFWLGFAQYFPGYFSVIFIGLGRSRGY
ncbi:MAG: hypothetical protein ACRD21_26440 [Vicinamibacteria bacterium]